MKIRSIICYGFVCKKPQLPGAIVNKYFVLSCLTLFLITGFTGANAGAIFLTGHDPDFHASDSTGARNINNAAIDYILDPAFNTFSSGGLNTFLFVESSISPPAGHRIGKNGIIASGYTEGVDFVHADASTLNAAIDSLGSAFAGIVVASDFGGILTQAELDILNSRSGDIINFLNNGGGLYAMAEGNSGAGLTPGGGHFGFLPFVASSTAFNSSETGVSVTPFGASLGLTDADVSSNFSHNIFLGTFGLDIVDTFPSGSILSLAGRGVVGGGGVNVPEPQILWLLGLGLLMLSIITRRKKLHN